jgi:hypothetical protein
VFLKNGEVFEDVITEVSSAHVRIRLAGGELRLPLSQVDRVVKAESSLARLEARRATLSANDPADAGAWLELASWALQQSLRTAAREAALVAAALDPNLTGLDRLLEGLGYLRDEASGRWLPEAQVMERRGLVKHGGSWISREQLAQEQELARERYRAETERRRAEVAEAAIRQRENRPSVVVAPVIQAAVVQSGVIQNNNYLSFIYATPYPAPYLLQPQPLPTADDGAGRAPGSIAPRLDHVSGFTRHQPSSTLHVPGSLIP